MCLGGQSVQAVTELSCNLHSVTTTHLTAFFQGNLGKTALDGLNVLDFNEARYDVVAVASSGPYGSHLRLASVS